MADLSTTWPGLVAARDVRTPSRIATSAAVRDGGLTTLTEVERWLAGQNSQMRVEVTGVDRLAGWLADPGTGDIEHESGRYFAVRGIAVDFPGDPVDQWHQPIIDQPETGVLGILVQEHGGVLHCLMQAKTEPGNRRGTQISPTVQATYSNYTRVHGGKPVPYLEYFLDTARHRVLADVRQSEQGSWFLGKRNRNMVVEVDDTISVLDGFHWMTIGQLHELLAVDELVNMDCRTVLACMPFAGPGFRVPPGHRTDFRAALARSCDEGAGGAYSTDSILSWLTGVRAGTTLRTGPVGLAQLPGWVRTPVKITHSTGRFFDVIGVNVADAGREVDKWAQPMLRQPGVGVVAFLASRIHGVLHVLVHARPGPGYVDLVELAPTVQCMPGNYDYLPRAARPPYLDDVLRARPAQFRFTATLAEEGGRFYHARNQYSIVEIPYPGPELPGYRWMTVHQLTELMRHSHYVDIEARSLIACLHSLLGHPSSISL